MSQANYNEQGTALVGQKYALLKDNVLSLVSEGAVKFGRFVVLGTDKDLQGKVPAAALDITSIKAKRGVALQQHSIENKQDGLDPQYEDKHPMSVMDEGGVYVECEEAVTPDSDVFVRFANGAGGTEKGIFRTDADTATAAALAGARFIKASVLENGKHIAVLQLGVA